MTENLSLVICENYRKEMEIAIENLQLRDIQVTYYSAVCPKCLQNRSNLCENINNTVDKTSYACSFLDAINKNSKQNSTPSEMELCHTMLIGDSILKQFILKGYYIITPGWLKNWRYYLIEINKFDSHTAKEFFGECITKLLLIDSGVYEDIENDLRDFSSYTGVEYEILSAGLDYIEMNLTNIFNQWKLQSLENTMNERNKEFSDSALVMDFLKRIAPLLHQDLLVNNIFDLFVLMTGASKLAFLPIIHEKLESIHFYNDIYYISELSNINITSFPNQYRMTTSGSGFIFKLVYNSQLLGFLEVEDILFTKHMESYLELSKTVMDIFSLSISNSRTYEQLLIANNELNVLNTSLEKLVSERTA